MALLLTFLSGLFFLVGIIIYKYSKNKVKLSHASIACAGVVIIGLLIFDLIPEVVEIHKWWMILFVLLGFILLLLLDKFVPHHEHEHHEHDEEKIDHVMHMEHISTITILALLLHNMIEGMALYGVSSNNIKSGLLMLLGIGLHNLPFGFQIGSFSENKDNRLLILFLVLSGFIGGIFFSIFGSFNYLVEGVILSLTIGMLLHILIFELLKEIIQEIKKIETIYGIIIGIIILIIINLL